MVVLIKFVLFVSVLFIRLAVIQLTGLTWFEAQRCCASKSGQLATIDDTIVNCRNIQSGAKTLWTGNARKPSEWIEFQGCYEFNGNTSYHNNISECYQKCLKQQNSFEYFSYKENQCMCPFIDNITKTDDKKNVCLITAQTNFLWVYKVLYNASFDGYGNCVASKCTNGSGKNVAEKCASSQIPMCGLPSENKLSINSPTNWNKSQSNCKDPHSKENNATDMCKVNKDTTEIGMWTNIFRVEISSHVDHADNIDMTDISSCVIAKCPNNGIQFRPYYTNCNEMADAFFCKTANSKTVISSGDCKSQTTSIYNLSIPHTIAESTVSSSVSKYKHQLSSSTQNHYSTETLTTVNTGLICGVTVGGVVLIAVIVIITCKMRNVGPFRKGLYNEDNIEMNNSIDCAIPVYHDTVLNTDNAGLPKNAIRNNTAENSSNGGERQNNRYFSNYEYAVVVKKHPAGPAGPAGPAEQPSEFDLEEDDNQSQRVETEDEYDALKHTVDKGEEQLENNVYDSSLGICDGVDPTYNSVKIGPVNNDTTYDHTANIVQKQVNNDTTYDHTANIVQK